MNQPFIASFSGTAVEILETVAIAYALIRAGFVREALLASVLGLTLAFVAGVLLWPLHALFPVFWLRLATGVVLTYMGIQWTQKSVRRVIAHKRPGWVDNPLGALAVEPRSADGFSTLVFVAMTKSALLEGFEVLIVAYPIAAATGA